MNAEVQVIEGGLAHAGVLSALHTACFETGWTEKAMTEVLTMPGAFALLATLKGEPLGFILCTTAADESEVVAVGTLPVARRQGTAETLLAAALAKAKGRGSAMMFLEVAEDNTAARGLYARKSFAEVGRRKGYYSRINQSRVDALILSKRLSE